MSSTFLAMLSAVHPHTRGEHRSCATVMTLRPGSSPHAWGTPVDQLVNRVTQRFIPTRVGNTEYNVNAKGMVPVHPHTRGEHLGNFL